jgi:hypothetical protein
MGKTFYSVLLGRGQSKSHWSQKNTIESNHHNSSTHLNWRLIRLGNIFLLRSLTLIGSFIKDHASLIKRSRDPRK